MMFVISKSPRWMIKMLRNIPIHGSKLDEIYVCLYLTDNKHDWEEFKWFWAPNSIETRSFRKVNKSHPRLLQSFSLPRIKTAFCKNQSSLKANMKPLCVCARACVRAFVFYSCLSLSHLSPKIPGNRCDFPPDYTPQLFNTFEDKQDCRVSHLAVSPPPPPSVEATWLWACWDDSWVEASGLDVCRNPASQFLSLAVGPLCVTHSAALCVPQSQYEDDHVAGPPLGKEGEAPWEVRGWRYVLSLRSCSTQAYISPY